MRRLLAVHQACEQVFESLHRQVLALQQDLHLVCPASFCHTHRVRA
jgi:hypothetical protein